MKRKLKSIVEFEYKWWYLYEDCYGYYSKLDELSELYDSVLKALYQSYFGDELGSLLYNYVSDDIQDYIVDHCPVNAIVDNIYNNYWPNPEEKIEELEKEQDEALKENEIREQERCKRNNEKLDEVCFKTGMSPEELFNLFR